MSYQCLAHLSRTAHAAGADAFNLDFSIVHRLRKCHGPAHYQGLRQLGHHHGEPAPVQPRGHPGGQITRTADQNESIRDVVHRISDQRFKIQAQKLRVEDRFAHAHRFSILTRF